MSIKDPLITIETINLVLSMLHPDKKKRITAEKALKHDFFNF